jgi:hypothetical protein
VNRPGGGSGGDSTSLRAIAAQAIDTSGKRATLKIGALVSTILAALYYAVVLGVIRFINAVRTGLTGAVSDLEAWVANEGGLIPLLFGIPEASFRVAVRETATWVGGAGVVAQGLAVLVIVVAFGLVGWFITLIGEKLAALVGLGGGA